MSSMRQTGNKVVGFDDSSALQNDLIRILDGVNTANIDSGISNIDIEKCFEALRRISDETTHLRYYFQLIYKILRKSVFCKGFEIPEILLEQMKAKEETMSIQVNFDIPYIKINGECLQALSQVIKKAQQVERDSMNSIEELKAQLKVKDIQLANVQNEYESIKNLSKSTIAEKFIQISEKVSFLTKENHMLFYKCEIAKEENAKLDIKLTLKTEEANRVKEELKITQNEILEWEAKYKNLFEKMEQKKKHRKSIKSTNL